MTGCTGCRRGPITTLDLPGPGRTRRSRRSRLAAHQLQRGRVDARCDAAAQLVGGGAVVHPRHERSVPARRAAEGPGGERADPGERAGACVHQHVELLSARLADVRHGQGQLRSHAHRAGAAGSEAPARRTGCCSGSCTRCGTSVWCPPDASGSTISSRDTRRSMWSPPDDLVEYFRQLERGREIFYESGAVHVHTSMMAIALLGLFQRLLDRGGPPSPCKPCGGGGACSRGRRRTRRIRPKAPSAWPTRSTCSARASRRSRKRHGASSEAPRPRRCSG